MSEQFEEEIILKKHNKRGGNTTEIKEMWRRASQPLTSFETDVRKALIEGVEESIRNKIKQAKGETVDDSGRVFAVCIGDKYYIANRHLLHSSKSNVRTIDGMKTVIMNLVDKEKSVTYAAEDECDEPESSKQKKPQKKGANAKNTAEKLKAANSAKTITELITKMMTVFNAGELVIPRNYLSHDILEIRGIAFLYLAWWIIENRDSYLTVDKMDLETSFSIIVGMQRFLKSVANYDGANYVNTAKTCKFSRALFDDMNQALVKCITLYKFNGLSLYEKVPSLIGECQYDAYIPRKMVKPYPHQMIAADVLLDRTNYTNGCVVFNTVQTNAGKTSGIVAIASALKFMRSYSVNKVLIATCPVRAVLAKMANFLYHCDDLPFGVAQIRINFKTKKPELKVSYGYACKGRPENCVVIICGVDAAIWLLSEENAADKYVLFQDEVTFGADCEDESRKKALEQNMRIIKLAPKITYLASATLSDSELNSVIANNFKKKYPDARVVDIRSNTIYGCCNVVTNDGDAVMPFNGCETQDELQKVLSNVEEKPFYGKFNNPLALKRIQDDLKEFPIVKSTKLPNLGEFFADVDNLSADNVRKVTNAILNTLASSDECDDEVVEHVCAETQISSHVINYPKLGTNDAYRYPRMNLVASNMPEQFVMENFADLLLEIKRRCKSMSDVLKCFDKEMDIWLAGREKIEGQKITEDEIARELCEYDELKPRIEFPKVFQINTREHIRKYAGEAVLAKCKRVRAPLALEDIDFDGMNVSDDLQLLLCAGVGVFKENDEKMNNVYLNTVLELASQGRLEYLVADSSIVYGTDYPIGGVFVTEDFSEKHSLNTIYQLISRAGRGRNSLFADVFMPSSCVDKIMSSVRGANIQDNEKENMIKYLE